MARGTTRPLEGDVSFLHGALRGASGGSTRLSPPHATGPRGSERLVSPGPACCRGVLSLLGGSGCTVGALPERFRSGRRETRMNVKSKALVGSAILGSMIAGGVIGASLFGAAASAQTSTTTTTTPAATSTPSPGTAPAAGTFKPNEDATHEAGESAAREAQENAGQMPTVP